VAELIQFTIETGGNKEFSRKLEQSRQKLPDVTREGARKFLESAREVALRILHPHNWRNRFPDLIRVIEFERRQAGSRFALRASQEAAFFEFGIRPHFVRPHKHPPLAQWAAEHGVFDRRGRIPYRLRVHTPPLLPLRRAVGAVDIRGHISPLIAKNLRGTFGR
jgi:hypothetical protein